jgi:hypothetical protein
VSPSALPQCLCGSGGNPALQVLLANIIRCPSHPGTTELDAGHPASVIWKQGDYNYTIGSHIALLRAIILSLERLFAPPPSPPLPGCTRRATNYGMKCAPRWHIHTHTHRFFYTHSGVLTRTREPARRLRKGNTSAQHEPRVCIGIGKGDGQGCHITDVINPTQASRNSRSVVESVYDVSKSRYGFEEAFFPCKAPLLFRAAPVS